MVPSMVLPTIRIHVVENTGNDPVTSLICIIIVVLVVIVDLIEAHICFSWKLFLNFLMKRWCKINNGVIQMMSYIKILSCFSVYFHCFSQPDALRRGYNSNNLS